MHKFTSFLSSRRFFWIIVAFFVSESLWIALSFRYPMLYDEQFHFGIIKIFSHQLLPFITNQPKTYDGYGDLAHQGLLYHYVMSWPYRLIEAFTASQSAQVIFLRVLNIAMAGSGFVIYSRLFRRVGMKQVYINVALLFFALLPITPFLAATINYDNLLFPLAALYLLACVRLVLGDHITWRNVTALIILGCLASLVQFSFLPIFTASILYLLVILTKRHGKKLLEEIYNSTKKTNKLFLGLSTLGVLLSVSLFSNLYIQNIVRYKTPSPSCTATMGRQRCLSDGLERRNIVAFATRQTRPVLTLSDYTKEWIASMEDTTLMTGANTPSGAVANPGLPIMYNLMYFLPIASIGVLAYAWRSLRKNDSWYFLLVTSVALTAVVYLVNVQSYYNLHAAYANQVRYILPVLPIFIIMVAYAASDVLRNYRKVRAACLIFMLLLFTQGGGLVGHILPSQDSWYWDNSTVIKANHAAKKLLSPLVKGG